MSPAPPPPPVADWLVILHPAARPTATRDELMSPRFLAAAGVCAPVAPSVALHGRPPGRCTLTVGTRPHAQVLAATRAQVLAIAATSWCDPALAARWCATTSSAASLALDLAAARADLDESWSATLDDRALAQAVRFGNLFSPNPHPDARAWLGFAETLTALAPSDTDQVAEISRGLAPSWSSAPTELAVAACALLR